MDKLVLIFNTSRFKAGDPLSPLLFDIAVDILVVFIKRTHGEGLLTGLATYPTKGEVSILQYADGTILLEDDLEQARNLKIIICLFEQMPE
jgi:hypothetical protein